MNLASTPRTVRSVGRRALRPAALAGAALALLALAAAGCAAPAAESPTAAPAAVVANPAAAVAVGSGGGAAAPAVAASTGTTVRTSATGKVHWPQLTWYNPKDGTRPARIWRQTPAGTWKLVRQGNPGEPRSLTRPFPSPDGRLAAWTADNPKRLVIDRFSGGAKHTVPIKATSTCDPSWLDNHRVVFGQGRDGDWTFVAVNADGTGRRVVATHQRSCPQAAAGRISRYDNRTVTLRDERGHQRTVRPRIPVNLRIHGVPGISADGRSLVIGTHVPSSGDCGCGWRFRNYRVDMASGAAVELTPLDPAWRKPTGHGEAVKVIFLPAGRGLVAQIDAGTFGDTPHHRLVRYAANGRVLASRSVPAGDTWTSSLLG
ncbi:hypothetical protein [Micromonospora mirobrigensis]|uniref:WD40-like Beta Propeller Repeat n=1 Tax=Micromonospora mirobrigensis TaxID=262898 RepID=A0A1C4VUT3_9ACTN|nr:hypothetical protein [Micromonospora mirobrigensis]SCE87742.1 hypothetical protein GA0070564_1011472 [Micromonospora mirobrigensis]